MCGRSEPLQLTGPHARNFGIMFEDFLTGCRYLVIVCETKSFLSHVGPMDFPPYFYCLIMATNDDLSILEHLKFEDRSFFQRDPAQF